MRIRTQVRAGWGTGDGEGGGGRLASNHNEALKIRSTVKAGGSQLNHSETLRTGSAPAIAMLRQPRTTSRKEDRLELLVIRAGLRAGRRESRSRK